MCSFGTGEEGAGGEGGKDGEEASKGGLRYYRLVFVLSKKSLVVRCQAESTLFITKKWFFFSLLNSRVTSRGSRRRHPCQHLSPFSRSLCLGELTNSHN